MSLVKYLSVRKSFFVMIIGFVVFILYLYFFVGFKEIFAVLENVSYLQFSLFFSLSIASSLFSMFLFSVSWQKLLNALSIKISLKRTFQYHSVGNFVDLVVPCQTICGEVTRVYLVYKEAKENYGRIFASASINRFLDNSIGIFVLSIGAAFLLSVPNLLPGYILGPLILVMVGFIAYNAILVVVAIRYEAAERFLSGLLRFLEIISLNRFRKENSLSSIQESLHNFGKEFKILSKNPRHLLMPVVLLCMSWIFKVLSFALAFYALNYWFLSVSFFLVAFSLMSSIGGAAGTFSVGALDILMTNFFVFFGIPIGASGVAMLLERFVVFWIHIFVGYVIIQLLGVRTLLSTNANQKS